jgi:hypothetical protein
MPKHSFKFSQDIKNAVKLYIDEKVREIDPRRFKQEPAYVSSLFSRIEGVAYRSPKGMIKFRATIVNDRGPKSAESLTGADFIITADISVGANRIQKAIVGQAKLNSVDSMSPSQRDKLHAQIRLIRSELKYEHPKVMEIIDIDGFRQPKILSGVKFLMGENCKRETLSDYMVGRVLTTLDGNTDPDFVLRVQDSSLNRLHAKAKLSSKALKVQSNRDQPIVVSHQEIMEQIDLFSDFSEDQDFLGVEQNMEIPGDSSSSSLETQEIIQLSLFNL